MVGLAGHVSARGWPGSWWAVDRRGHAGPPVHGGPGPSRGVRAALEAWPAVAARCAWAAAPWPAVARWERRRYGALRTAANARACSVDRDEVAAWAGHAEEGQGRTGL